MHEYPKAMVSWDMKKHKHIPWPTDVWNIKYFLKRATEEVGSREE